MRAYISTTFLGYWVLLFVVVGEGLLSLLDWVISKCWLCSSTEEVVWVVAGGFLKKVSKDWL
jgi:hypothetical protein